MSNLIFYFLKVIRIIYYKFKCFKETFLNNYYIKKLDSRSGSNIRFVNAELDTLIGLNNIIIGSNSFFGRFLTLTAWEKHIDEFFTPSIIIGKNCNFGEYNHITSINKIIIGDNFLTGRWVTITDNSHGDSTLSDMNIAPVHRKIKSKGPVIIGNNVWIGDKATILPGVVIGDGVIIGANTVVSHNIPSYSVVCGNPAKIIKQF